MTAKQYEDLVRIAMGIGGGGGQSAQGEACSSMDISYTASTSPWRTRVVHQDTFNTVTPLTKPQVMWRSVNNDWCLVDEKTKKILGYAAKDRQFWEAYDCLDSNDLFIGYYYDDKAAKDAVEGSLGGGVEIIKG